MQGDISSSALTDPAQQAQVYEYLERLKQDPNAWRSCVQSIVDGSALDPHNQFLFLQVIESYLRTQYLSTSTEADQQVMRALMSNWLERVQSGHVSASPVYLKNKMALIFSLIFVVDFPSRWPGFFKEVFLNNLASSPNVVEFYLRTLMAIDSEVADREIQRSKTEFDRNTVIKDAMRELCIPDLVQSWLLILRDYRASNGKVTELCLNVIGSYISWIDVNLIANEQFVPLIVDCLSREEADEAATDCICAILQKGMPPVTKLELVEAMINVLQHSGVFNVTQNSDEDALTKVGELVNCLGTVVIECYNKWVKSEQQQAARALALIESKLPLMLVCLSNEDNDVSGCVTEFCHQYILLLKQLPQLNDQQRELVKQLMFVVMQKYRFPDDYDHEREGENEAIFLEYRKEVKLIITNLGMLDSNLLVTTIDSLVSDTLQNWRSRSHQVIELALSLVYVVGEALTVNPGNLSTSTDDKAIKLKNMILLVVASGVSQNRHVSVNLEYFEIVCRYDKLFASETQAIPEVLASFLDDRGLRHSSKKLRSRVVYLFARFVKAQKSVLHDHVETVLSQLADLLAVNPRTDQDPLISADDQLFLYEATGTLIVFGNFVPEKKKIYMEQLLGGLVGKFMDGLAALPTITEPEQKALVVEFLNNIMAYTSRTTKAFSNQLSMQNCLCSDVFVQLMATFLNAVTPENNALLDGLRQYLHRMVVCLENEMLPYLPEIITKFLSVASDLKALQDFLILMQQLLAKYKSNIVPHIQAQMPQLLGTFWTVLDAPHDLTDETISRDLTYLKRAYLQMLNASVTHDTLDLWTAGGAEVLQKLVASLVGFALQPQDHTTQRQSFGTIQKLVTVVAKEDKAHHRSWVDELLWKQAIVACFQAPTMDGFDLADAQCALVLHEIAQCFRQIFALKGDEFVSFVVGNCLNGLPQQRTDEFIESVKQMEGKLLQKYLKKFFVELRQLRLASSS